ncbi:hypothetical protein OS493_011004 [Desmophyllum pertusum]|uniref:Uncharacterized protein n=1 Tax=Desmophyllum pertusum TaxID=174260 RepID=A0A9W9ZGY1_9CNID|nr:hypothetical protein OS493_011004 [Desmophyllum pertusum]
MVPCLVFQRLGAEGEEEDVGGEIVFSTIGADSALSARGTAARAQGAAGAAGAAGAVVRGHVAEDIMLNEGVSARTRVAVVQPVRVPTALSEEELVHVTTQCCPVNCWWDVEPLGCLPGLRRLATNQNGENYTIEQVRRNGVSQQTE